MSLAGDHERFTVVREQDGWHAYCTTCDWCGPACVHPLDCGAGMTGHTIARQLVAAADSIGAAWAT